MWTATHRQNLDRVNIFRPVKPSVFLTTEDKPWCVWLPNLRVMRIGPIRVEREPRAYRFPSHFAATAFVRMVFELNLRGAEKIERHAKFYGGEPA